MKPGSNSRHSMEAVLPIILFFVFTLCAVVLVVLSANIYRGTTENSFFNNSARTSISYVTEKIHRYDRQGRIDIEEFDGCRAVVLKQTTENGVYNTYIYSYDGWLCELFVKEGTEVYADSGTKILQTEYFKAEFSSENLLKLSCATSGAEPVTSVVGLKHHRK